MRELLNKFVDSIKIKSPEIINVFFMVNGPSDIHLNSVSKIKYVIIARGIAFQSFKAKTKKTG